MAVSTKSWPKSKTKNAILKKLRFLFIMGLGLCPESNKKNFDFSLYFFFTFLANLMVPSRKTFIAKFQYLSLKISTE